MNAAVDRGLAEAVAAAGAEAALVLTADLPLAQPGGHRRGPGRRAAGPLGRLLVPSRDGTGTNAMLLRPPGGAAPRLGPDSLRPPPAPRPRGAGLAVPLVAAAGPRARHRHPARPGAR